jgi:hypothetical protein
MVIMKLLIKSLAMAAFLTASSVFALEVTRFGAVPNDGQDDTAAFLAAFKEAQAKGDKRISIPKGHYDLHADGNPARPDTLFPIAGVDGLIIDGQGTELMMTGKAAIFAFANCQNVTVSGLTVDWARPPFSEGTVIATAPRHFDVKVADAYPVKGGELVGAFMSYHPDTRLPDGRDLDVYEGVERTELIAPQVLRVHLKWEIPVPVGKLLVLRHQVYGCHLFGFYRCANVTVSNVTVYCAPGMGLVGMVSTNVSLQQFNVQMRPGSGRLMSATADATHFSGCKGTVLLEDCTFEGMGDDGVNIKSSLYLSVWKRVDDHTVLAQHNLKFADLPDEGDTLEMAHTNLLSAFATGTVRQAKLVPGEGNVHRVEFTEPLPTELRAGDVLGNASRVARFRMLRCTVRANRARGVLCQTRDALIENCTFQNCTSAGVLVLTEAAHFFEAIGTRNVTVRSNRFENCNRGAAAAEAALCAVAYLKGYSYPAKPGVHRDVTLQGNRIVGTDESGIFAVAVDGLTVRANTIERFGLRAAREHGGNPIWVQDCSRVVLDGLGRNNLKQCAAENIAALCDVAQYCADKAVGVQLPSENGKRTSSSGASGSTPQITFEGHPPARAALYAKYEVAFVLDREYDNPFDPEQISVEAVFESPSGKTIRVPGFFYQDYPEDSVRLEKSSEGKAGPSGWRIRFAPSECGKFQGKIIARDRAGQNETKLPEFVVSPSDNPGFIHATQGARARTVFDNGRMFLPLGECLWEPRSLATFETEFDRYAQHGMNYFRFFTTHDSMFFFENARRPAGQYDQFILRKLDLLFDALAVRGLYAMPCLEMFSDFRTTQPYPYWDENAYNLKNNGPCRAVADFFTDPEARRLYKNRLRYFLARYGYSPNLFCLQLFAEVNYVEQYQQEPVRAWHREMADYIHSIDPYGHLVSTSMAAWDAQDRELFALPGLDLVLNELYNARDFAGELAQDNRDILARYRKPVFLAECGITFEYFGVTDPVGVHIHSAIWSNPLSGGIGVPSFWWGSYIREKNLLPHFKAFADFVKGEDFVGLAPIEVRTSCASKEAIQPDLIIPYPYLDPPASAGPQTISLPNDRFIDEELPNMPHVFHARTKPTGEINPAYNPITFETDFAADGAITIFPRWVDGPTNATVALHVCIDDRLAGEVRYNGCPTTDWPKFIRHSQATCVPTTFAVSRGRHRIVLANNGTLHMSAAVDFQNYLSSKVVNLRALGLGDKERAYIWIQNRDNTWWRHCLKRTPRVIRGATVSLPGMRKGTYAIEWWNTVEGRCIKRERLKARGETLNLRLPDLETDIACKIKRLTSSDAASPQRPPIGTTVTQITSSKEGQGATSQDEYLVGIYYFAGWWQKSPNKWETAGHDWRPDYPKRVPLLGEYNDQPTMDREIATAANHGVDFFQILWYPDGGPLNEGLLTFTASTNASRMKFTLEFVNHPPFGLTNNADWEAACRQWCAAMKHPSYLRLDGRPVFKIHGLDYFYQQNGSAQRQVTARLDCLRRVAKENGLSNPLISGGVMPGEVPPSSRAAPFDFLTTYMDMPHLPQRTQPYPYELLIGHAEEGWFRYAEHASKPYVPYVPAGWDPRPWRDPRPSFTFPTRQEWVAALGRVKAALDKYPQLGIPVNSGTKKMLLIYAWNEFGEGGIVVPTHGDREMKLEAVRDVFGKARGIVQPSKN